MSQTYSEHTVTRQRMRGHQGGIKGASGAGILGAVAAKGQRGNRRGQEY